MLRLTLLHTNDLHGQVDELARIATLVEQIRNDNRHRVVYVDSGDIEETTTPISSLTKGVAMHRLLSAAGCDAAAVGNAAWLRYGPQVVAEHAEVARYPLLCVNLRPLPGARETALVRTDGGTVGLLGVTDPVRSFLDGFDYGIEALDEIETVRTAAEALRKGGAELVVVLSHLGYDVPEARIDDRRLAEALHEDIDLIIGAHSHHLLSEGEWISGVLVTQAGSHGKHLGRVDIVDGRLSASVVPVPPDTPPHPAITAELTTAEADLATHLGEVIGKLPEALDREGAALWLAAIYRERMGANVGLATPGASFAAGLPAGPLTRRTLWEVCHSSGNPGVCVMTGEQLLRVIERGRDPEFAASTARPLRGQPRGLLQVSGPELIEADRRYTVAACDWELEPYGGMVEQEWGLEARYDFPTIVREAIEDHLSARQRRRPKR